MDVMLVCAYDAGQAAITKQMPLRLWNRKKDSLLLGGTKENCTVESGDGGHEFD